MLKRNILFLLSISLLFLSGCGDNQKPEKNTDAVFESNSGGSAETAFTGEKQVITLGMFSDSKEHIESGGISYNFLSTTPRFSTYPCNEMNTYLRGCVNEFNKTSMEYEIEIIEYGEVGTLEASEKLSTELGSGNSPDILFLQGCDYERYAKKGYFLDLYTFFGEEGDDGAVSKDDFFIGPLQSMEYHGKLYCFSPEVVVLTYCGLTSEIGDIDMLSAEELMSLWNAAERPNEVLLPTMFLTGATSLDLFELLFIAQRDRFIDIENNFADLESQEFINLLKLCNSVGMQKIQTPLMKSRIERTSTYLANKECLLSGAYVEYFSTYSEFTTFAGENVSYIGIPGAETGDALCFSVLPMAITADSKNSEGAWKFISSLITRDFAVNIVSTPIHIDTFNYVESIPKRYYETFSQKEVYSFDE